MNNKNNIGLIDMFPSPYFVGDVKNIDCTVIGIDLSYKETAIVYNTKEYKNGLCLNSIYYSRLKFSNMGLFSIYSKFKEEIDMHQTLNTTLVILEGYSFGSSYMLATMGELGGICKTVLEELDIPYILVAPNSLKKFITGDGHSKKDKIMQQVLKIWGFEAPSSDVADAFGLWKLGCSVLEYNTSTTKYQNILVKNLRKEHKIKLNKLKVI